jgi:predicted ester cyclase
MLDRRRATTGLSTLLAWVMLAGTSLAMLPAGADARQATPAACAKPTREMVEASVSSLSGFAPVPASLADELLAPGFVHHGSMAAPTPDLDAAAWLRQRNEDVVGLTDTDLSLEVAAIDGPWAMTVWTVTGSIAGDAPGTPEQSAATSAPVRVHGADLYRFDCGKIAEVWGLQSRIDDPAAMPLAVPPPPAACAVPAPTREEADAMIRAWVVDGWSDGDLAVLDPLLSPDVAYHAIPYSETNGPEGVNEAITDTHAAFPDMVNVPDQIVIDGAWAGSRWKTHGTNSGGGAPTGKTATWTGIDLLRIDCGKIVEIWSVEDTAAVARQLGE